MSVAGRVPSHDPIRDHCRGRPALSARLEPWQARVCNRPEALTEALESYGSPVNLIDPGPMRRNAAELADAAAAAGVPMTVFFARKANKSIALVDEARRLGLGVDVASERELAQVIARGFDPARVVVTAAVKPEGLLRLCLQHGATVVLDNLDEIDLLVALARGRDRDANVALRIAPRHPDDAIATRFGLGGDELEAACERLRGAPTTVSGIHFHLDGYDAARRVAAIGQGLALSDRLRAQGQRPGFLDIGGGIPMSYLDSAEEWERFWSEHRRGLLGEGEPVTFDGHGLGLVAHDGVLVGRPNVYPYFQSPVRGAWLAELLASPAPLGGSRRTIAESIVERGLELRCEPGRALLDGCGMTAARVMFTKPRADGARLVGLAMNRTQCRSTSDDFLVDPLLVPARGRAASAPFEGFLVGAYCIERELLSLRRLWFPRGVAVGDVIVFPNTAGYLMHILESSSHQMPLARNVVVDGHDFVLDPIDAGRS